MTDTLHNDLLDGIYKVAVEPERFRELTQIWGGYLSELDGKEYSELTSDFSQLEEHLNQASSILDMVETSSCLLYTSPSPRDATLSRMPSSA